MTAVRQTARALAADRSTKLLPIIVAQTLFIGAIGIAIGRLASAGRSMSSSRVFINVEVHGVAFSALYFWIIPAVILSSVIGVSQTKAAIPRVLRRFQIDLDRLLSPADFKLSNGFLDEKRLALPKQIEQLNECLEKDQRRIFSGGVYSWQPLKKRHHHTPSVGPGDIEAQNAMPILDRKVSADSPLKSSHGDSGSTVRHKTKIERLLLVSRRKSHKNPIHSIPAFTFQNIVSLLAVMLGTATGYLITSLVPPGGMMDCRRIAHSLMCLAWILSALVDVLSIPLFRTNSQKLIQLFWATLLKDVVITVATLSGIIVTQAGVFNRCSCYTNWGRTGLALPWMPDVAATLLHRLDTAYPAITFTSIGIELIVIPLFICFRYNRAIRVFMQRDDRCSNAVWLRKVYRGLQHATRNLFNIYPSRYLRKLKSKRETLRSYEKGYRNQSE